MEIIFWSVIFLNALSLVLMGIDKFKAKANKFRISEFTLLLSGALGAFGFVLSMILFHHKFSKAKFRYLGTLFFLLHAISVGVLVYHLMQF